MPRVPSSTPLNLCAGHVENVPESLRPNWRFRCLVGAPIPVSCSRLPIISTPARHHSQPEGESTRPGLYQSVRRLPWCDRGRFGEGQNLEIVERSVVIFTDGVHEAGDLENQRRLALDAKSDAEANGRLTTFGVYSGANNDEAAIEAIRELASDDGSGFRAASLDDINALTAAFDAFALRLRDIAQSNYGWRLYASRVGEGRMSIVANVDGVASDPLVLTYPPINSRVM